MEHSSEDYRQLAAYRHCAERISAQWGRFQKMRTDRLRHGSEVEKVAETILEDLFTEVLDWSKGDLLYQERRADIVLSQNGMKYLLLEVKRPGSLHPNSRSLEDAVMQAQGYAETQSVAQIAVSDGRFLFATDIADNRNKLIHRAFVDLTQRAAIIMHARASLTFSAACTHEIAAKLSHIYACT